MKNHGLFSFLITVLIAQLIAIVFLVYLYNDTDNKLNEQKKKNNDLSWKQHKIIEDISVIEARRAVRDSLEKINSKHRQDEIIEKLNAADAADIRRIILQSVEQTDTSRFNVLQ